jgi:hypothetical protein
MITETKKKKADAILQCAHAIAEFYGTTAEKLLSATAYRGRNIQNARTVFAYHLHDCGISIASIAGMLTRSIHSTEERVRQGSIFLMGKDRDMIENLPRIPLTLNISRA